MRAGLRALFSNDSNWRVFTWRWRIRRHTDSAAALTFYSLVSLVPMLLVGVTVAGGILGEQAAHGELERKLAAVIGPEAAAYIERVLQSSSILDGGSRPAFLGVLAVLLYSGSHVLSKLRETLNGINGVESHDPARPLAGRLLARGVCALLLLLFGGLLVLDTLMEGFAAFFARHLTPTFLGNLQLMRGYQMLSTFLLLALVFFCILKILPRKRPHALPALAGACFSSTITGFLKHGLDFYLSVSPLASVFGTGVTVLLFLFWLFLSIQAFLAGAELTSMWMWGTRPSDQEP